jgi:glycosyltransferase involved in cell wall biosynthesis
VTTLSVVVPIKDERDNLRPLCLRLCQALEPLCQGPTPRLRDYEVLFIDDGSSDGSFQILEELATADPRIKVVRLRRNFGQTPALQAGIDWSAGDIIVTMDGDLQNDPADIPLLLDKLAEGYDAVLGLRANRQDHFLIRKLPSNLANWLIRKVTGVHIKDMGCTLRAMRRELAEELPLYGELHRFVPVLAQQQGARLAQIPVRHHPRVAGQTKYNLSRTFRVLLDLITVKFLHSYLTRPMHVLGLAGLAAMGLGVLSLLATLWMKYISQPRVFMTGNPLLLFSVMLELVGVQLISMGLIGEMLSRTYFESQGKSSYVVRATLNLEPPEKRQAA